MTNFSEYKHNKKYLTLRKNSLLSKKIKKSKFSKVNQSHIKSMHYLKKFTIISLKFNKSSIQLKENAFPNTDSTVSLSKKLFLEFSNFRLPPSKLSFTQIPPSQLKISKKPSMD